jgi:hypothetical protein
LSKKFSYVKKTCSDPGTSFVRSHIHIDPGPPQQGLAHLPKLTTARRVDWDRESHGEEGCSGQAPVEPAGGEQIAARRQRGPPRQVYDDESGSGGSPSERGGTGSEEYDGEEDALEQDE